jgi:hypothetical protein
MLRMRMMMMMVEKEKPLNKILFKSNKNQILFIRVGDLILDVDVRIL